MPRSTGIKGGHNERRSGGWNRTTDLRAMTPASYQLLHPAIFRAFNTAYFTSLFVFILYAYRRGSGPGLPDLHLFVTQTSTVLSENISRKKKDSNLRAISDCHVSNVVLSATQPFFRCAALFSAVTGLCLIPSVFYRMNKRKYSVMPIYIMAAFALLFHTDSRSPYPWWRDSPCNASRYSLHCNGCVPGLRRISLE